MWFNRLNNSPVESKGSSERNKDAEDKKVKKNGKGKGKGGGKKNKEKDKCMPQEPE